MQQISSNEYRATSWEELQAFLFREKDDKIDRYRSYYAYRGVHNCDLTLVTSIQRLGRRPSTFEQYLLRNFKKYTHRSILEGSDDNIWNWMSIGQHYGLPTRLLDWTFSPNVALHFAANFEKDFDRDGIIWMVDFVKVKELLPKKMRGAIEKRGHTFTPEELESIIGSSLEDIKHYGEKHGNFMIFMEPPSIDERIVNQFALFSTMINPDTDIYTYLENHPDLFKSIIIPAELKWEIRDKLDQANISERIIYPGLEGIAKWLKRWYFEKDLEKHWKADE